MASRTLNEQQFAASVSAFQTLMHDLVGLGVSRSANRPRKNELRVERVRPD
jgi:hypothetical protein